MDLLLLHGFTGAPSSYQRVLELLPEGWRVWLPSLLGHRGPSVIATVGRGLREVAAPAGADYERDSFESYVDQLAAWAHHHGFERGLVGGYSLGARLALGLAVRHPSLVARACWMGVHPGLQHDGERLERAAADALQIAALETGGVERFIAEWEQLPLFTSQRALSEEVRARQRAVRLSHSPEGLAQSLRTCGLAQMPNYRDALPELEPVVELLVGELDDKFAALARAMSATLPHARLHVLPRCGHNPVLERPEDVARILRLAHDS